MLCAVIHGPTVDDIKDQIFKASFYANLLEFRLDLFENINLLCLQQLQQFTTIPLIFTLRSHLHGGKFQKTEQERLETLHQLAALKPKFIDIESYVPPSFIHHLKTTYPDIGIILSYHNFEETPPDLDHIYKQMISIPATFYKIACMANNALDALRLLCWHKTLKAPQLISISMGSYGQISRIIAPILQIPITYASIEDAIAPGQLSIQVLVERYHHHRLKDSFSIYGLIGDPVDQSISDKTHNDLIDHLSLDAVYIKVQVDKASLSLWLQRAKELPFKGLSVTMPLKEEILPYLDTIDMRAKEIGAVNTLLFDNSGIHGFNTDAEGALDAIETKFSVKDLHIAILGAGGAAKAIAYEAHQRGASLTIINRDLSKAQVLANAYHGRALSLDDFDQSLNYDLLINTIPLASPISIDALIPHIPVMDIRTLPKEPLFLQYALEKKCPVIYGYEMFIEQAAGQWALWLNEPTAGKRYRAFLYRKTQDVLSNIITTEPKPLLIIYTNLYIA